MGLFSKLKSNMDGGVQVHIQAPSSIAANQVIPVTVTVTADSSQTINNVKAEIKAQAREEGLTIGSGMGGMNMGGRGLGVQEGRTVAQTVAQVESREPFTIGPGETKTINLQLYLNGNAGSSPLGQIGNTGGVLGGALKAVATVAQGMEHINYLYSVHASADVQGHHVGPSDKQSIQILPPEATQAAQPTPFVGNAPNQVEPASVPPVPPTPTMPPPQPPPDGSSGQQAGPQF